MTWLLVILLLSVLAVVCVGIAIYLRIRRHMKASDPGATDSMKPTNTTETGDLAG